MPWYRKKLTKARSRREARFRFGIGEIKKAGRFTSELPSFTNYNPMNISLIYLDFSNGSFKRGQKVAIRQLSILQNYNPMNISKFESGTST
jgi:hypothetical protein